MNGYPKLLFLAMAASGLLLISACCRTLTYLTVLGEKDRQELRSHNVPSSLYDEMVLRVPISLDDIVVLSKCGVSKDFIFRYVDTSGRSYDLTDDDVARLAREGVDPEVIRHLKEVRTPAATRALQGAGSVFVGK